MLYIGRETIIPGQSGWPLPHDAPYTGKFDRILCAVVEVRSLISEIRKFSLKEGDKIESLVKSLFGLYGFMGSLYESYL